MVDAPSTSSPDPASVSSLFLLALGIFVGLIALLTGLFAVGIWVSPEDLSLSFRLEFPIVPLLMVGISFAAIRKARRLRQRSAASLVEVPPHVAQAARLRYMIAIQAIAVVVGSPLIAHVLREVEEGTLESTSIWAPIAWLYNSMGYGPALLVFPLVGIATLFVLIRRLVNLPGSTSIP